MEMSAQISTKRKVSMIGHEMQNDQNGFIFKINFGDHCILGYLNLTHTPGWLLYIVIVQFSDNMRGLLHLGF